MKTIRSPSEMQRLARDVRLERRKIGFVPTMGCLHAGHVSLMQEARRRSDWLVVSIFVNPAQFGPGEDFNRYPRALQKDCEWCKGAGVDVVFCPEANEMYLPNHSTYVDETLLGRGLCGRTRSGHFRGVTSVVAKLFNIVLPDVAVFGQKDAQQVRVVQQMVQDLNFPVEIVVAPTLREADGLAMSSRNGYLSKEDRPRAACIYRALRRVEELCRSGTRDAHALASAVRSDIEAELGAGAVEYVELVDYSSLLPVEQAGENTLVAVAARAGNTRLIDNLIVRCP